MTAPPDPGVLTDALTPLVRRVAPAATLHVDQGDSDYWCISWRIRNRAERELFVEYPGRDIAPNVLRVGVYFQDAPSVTAATAAFDVALEALTARGDVLQTLGAACTFTPGASTRDDHVFDWTTPELRRWLTAPCANRDLVRRWDTSGGAPPDNDLRSVIQELAPVWRAWNSLEG